MILEKMILKSVFYDIYMMFGALFGVGADSVPYLSKLVVWLAICFTVFLFVLFIYFLYWLSKLIMSGVSAINLNFDSEKKERALTRKEKSKINKDRHKYRK